MKPFSLKTSPLEMLGSLREEKSQMRKNREQHRSQEKDKSLDYLKTIEY